MAKVGIVMGSDSDLEVTYFYPKSHGFIEIFVSNALGSFF